MPMRARSCLLISLCLLLPISPMIPSFQRAHAAPAGKTASKAAPAPKPSPDLAKLEAGFTKILETSLKEFEAQGVVLALLNPSSKWVGAAGYADPVQKVKLKPEHCLRIPGITRTMVAVTLLGLVERGVIKLDSQVRAFLPSYVTEWIPNASRVTFRQLLSMRSGIPDYSDQDAFFDAIERAPERESWTPRDILQFLKGVPQVFTPPGKGWNLSNTNFIILGVAMERAAGYSLSGMIRSAVSNPLHLDGTFMEKRETAPDFALQPKNARTSRHKGKDENDQNEEGNDDPPLPSWEPEFEPIMAPFEEENSPSLLVRGHEGGEDVTEIDAGLGLADNGMVSRAAEVLSFMEALFIKQSLISKASLKAMTTFDKEQGWGLGLVLQSTPWGDAWTTGGSSCGFHSKALYLPKLSMVVVILSNTYGTDICDRVFESVMKVSQPAKP